MRKIAVLEKYKLHKEIPELDIWSQRLGTTSYVPHKEHGYYNLRHLLEGLRTLLTDEEIYQNIKIYYMGRTEFALDLCDSWDINTLSLSSEFMDFDKFMVDKFPELAEDGRALERKLAKDRLMFSGAGNDGNEVEEHFEAIACSRGTWIGIGAVSPEHRPRSYSSWGNGYVEFCGLDGLVDGKLGTSYATPYVTGVAEAYAVKHTLVMGYPPCKGQILAWLRKHCVDLLDAGKDLKTGYGVVVPPTNIEFMDTKFDVIHKTKVIRRYRDGKMFVEETDKLIYKDVAETGTITCTYVKGDEVAYFGHPV